MSAAGERLADQRGDAAAELVVLTPLAVVLLLFVILTFRVTAARGDVGAAARDAAEATLAGGLAPCAALDVDVNLRGFAPGGTVTATVTCDVALADLGLLGVPGSRRVARTATSPIDTYRGTSLGFATLGAGRPGQPLDAAG
jgi:hypothetical protein